MAVQVEQQLVQRLREGVPEAFDELYACHREGVFSFLLRLSRSRALAEDLLQETWLRAARGCARLRPDTKLKPWLYRIAYNLFISHRRWRLLDLERVGQLGLHSQGPQAAPSPFEVTAATDLQRRLEAALAKLPLKHREVLALVAVQGQEPSSAAQVLGLSPSTARQRLKRARDALAEALEESDDPAPRRS